MTLYLPVLNTGCLISELEEAFSKMVDVSFHYFTFYTYTPTTQLLSFVVNEQEEAGR